VLAFMKLFGVAKFDYVGVCGLLIYLSFFFVYCVKICITIVLTFNFSCILIPSKISGASFKRHKLAYEIYVEAVTNFWPINLCVIPTVF